MTASFLTQSLEREDRQGIPRRWPWPTFYNEVPQVVLQVGFGPVERVPAPPLYGAELSRKRSDRGPVQDSSLCGITNIILNG